MPRRAEVVAGYARAASGHPVVIVRMPADVIAAIDQAAKRNYRSRSAEIRCRVEQSLSDEGGWAETETVNRGHAIAVSEKPSPASSGAAAGGQP